MWPLQKFSGADPLRARDSRVKQLHARVPGTHVSLSLATGQVPKQRGSPSLTALRLNYRVWCDTANLRGCAAFCARENKVHCRPPKRNRFYVKLQLFEISFFLYSLVRILSTISRKLFLSKPDLDLVQSKYIFISITNQKIHNRGKIIIPKLHF